MSPVDRRPADQRRKRAGSAADDDVLRGAPLEPDRVDERHKSRWSAPTARPPTQLTASPITRTEPTASTTPKPSASPGIIRPAGNGRPAVRRMIASMSRSYHMLMAPAAPAPIAMHSTATAARTGWRCPGATASPTSAGKDDQRHDPRLEDLDIVAERRHRRSSSGGASARRASDSCDTAVRAPQVSDRQLVVAVERRRRRHAPFERRRAFAPVIGSDPPPGEQGVEHDEDEEQGRGVGDVGTDRLDEVPAGEGVGIIRDPPRHAGRPEKMHREEGQVDADERGPEMDLAERLVIGPPGHLPDPVIERRRTARTPRPSDST